MSDGNFVLPRHFDLFHILILIHALPNSQFMKFSHRGATGSGKKCIMEIGKNIGFGDFLPFAMFSREKRTIMGSQDGFRFF